MTLQFVRNVETGLLKEMVGMADLLDVAVIRDVNTLGQFDEVKDKQ